MGKAAVEVVEVVEVGSDGTGVSQGVSVPASPDFAPVETFSDWVDPTTVEDTVVTSYAEAMAALA